YRERAHRQRGGQFTAVSLQLAFDPRAGERSRGGVGPTRTAQRARARRRPCGCGATQSQHDRKRACAQSPHRDRSPVASPGRSTMKRVLLAFLNRPLFVALGVAAAAVLIWFVGPLLVVGGFYPLV